jgi:hypothetical protein
MSAIQSITRTSSSVQDGDEFHFFSKDRRDQCICVGERTEIVRVWKGRGEFRL